MSKKSGRLFFSLAMLLIPAIVITSAYLKSPFMLYEKNTKPASFSLESSERLLAQGFPFRNTLAQISLELRLLGGQKEQNGIFLSENRMMRNIANPNDDCVDANTQSLIEYAKFAQESGLGQSVYFMLIPTAGAVLQQHLPKYAYSVMVNQKEFIDEVYCVASSAGIETVDVYSRLFNNRKDYIYYRTDDNLTSLGGYHVYSVLCSVLGTKDIPLSRFDISYVDNQYYGNLYAKSPFKDAAADTIALYNLNAKDESIFYHITHYKNGAVKNYNSLYPRHLLQLQNPANVYLGGLSTVTKIETADMFSGRLLVFGDDTVISYLPFLANNYKEITVIDPSGDADDLKNVKIEDYSQILFAYSADSFMHDTELAKAGNLLP